MKKITHINEGRNRGDDTGGITAEEARLITKAAGIKDHEKYCPYCGEKAWFDANNNCMGCRNREKRRKLSEEVLAEEKHVYFFDCPVCDAKTEFDVKDYVSGSNHKHECFCCHEMFMVRIPN